VADAIRKGGDAARKSLFPVTMVAKTIPHEVTGVCDGGVVMLRPAAPGTGVIAGGGVRAVMESAGVQDVLTKIVGSRNPFNVVRATFDALANLMTTDQVRRLRGTEPGGAGADVIDDDTNGDQGVLPVVLDEAIAVVVDKEDEGS
jgi:small subunit ribosomal protein S5